MLDHLFHTVELAKGRIKLEHLVGEDTGAARVGSRIDQFRLTDRQQHALGNRGVGLGVALADIQVFLDRHFLFLLGLVTALVAGEY